MEVDMFGGRGYGSCGGVASGMLPYGLVVDDDGWFQDMKRRIMAECPDAMSVFSEGLVPGDVWDSLQGLPASVAGDMVVGFYLGEDWD